MNAKHTPGPWRTEKTRDHSAAYRVMDEQGVTVALCYQQPHDTWRAKDNARLIAAAPELLAALEKCADALEQAETYIAEREGEHDALPSPELQAAQDAIAKAKGEQ